MNPQELLTHLLDFVKKVSLSKQKYYFSKIKYLLIGILVFFAWYKIYYQQPDVVIDKYFSKINARGDYIEEAWDLLHEPCRKNKFRSYPDFKSRYTSDLKEFSCERYNSWSFKDIFPSYREYKITYWLPAKDISHVDPIKKILPMNSKNFKVAYEMKFSVEKFEDINRWKITQIDTNTVTIIY